MARKRATLLFDLRENQRQRTHPHESGAEPEPGPDYEQLKQIEWLIGDWEGDMVVPPSFQEIYPEGTTVHSKQSYFWMENKNYIGFKFRDEKDGKVLHQGFEVIGVDPQSKKLVHWIFSVAGGYGTGEWSREGDVWKLKWSGSLPNKVKYEGTSYLQQVDANTHTWQMKDTKRNGEKVPDYPVVTFRRTDG